MSFIESLNKFILETETDLQNQNEIIDTSPTQLQQQDLIPKNLFDIKSQCFYL